MASNDWMKVTETDLKKIVGVPCVGAYYGTDLPAAPNVRWAPYAGYDTVTWDGTNWRAGVLSKNSMNEKVGAPRWVLPFTWCPDDKREP